MTVRLSLEQIADLAARVLVASGTAPANAACVADSIVRAERDGIHSHGLFRLPTYADHARIGKVDGRAVPTVTVKGPGAVLADARTGFAHPAIDMGMTVALDMATRAGIVVLGVNNSYNCGVVGHHVEAAAERGFVAIAFVNAPASVAPHGGVRPLFGTDPLAFAAPRRAGAPLVADFSTSKIARSEIQVYARAGKALPPGWALDAQGQPTTDAAAAIKGSLLPMGEHKGTALALLIEIMAAALTGARFGFQADSFIANEGGAPRTGQCFILIDPRVASDGGFVDRVEALLGEFAAQAGAHLPGSRRLAARRRAEAEGVAVDDALLQDLERRAKV